MRCTPHEVHAYKLHAGEAHVREIHATRYTPMRCTAVRGTAYVREVQAREAFSLLNSRSWLWVQFDRDKMTAPEAPLSPPFEPGATDSRWWYPKNSQTLNDWCVG